LAQTYTVRIKNGTKSVKRCRIFLWWKKYTCIRRENSRVYYEKKVPDGKKIICSVIAEEGILHLKQCQRSIREAAITVAFFLQSIHHLPENTGVHTVGKRSQKIK
jgi:hypothetical protein